MQGRIRSENLGKCAETITEHASAGDDAALAKVVQQIDEIVYQLFGLEPEEIKIVEGKS